MTINFGTIAIAGAYLGTNEVSRMYFGDILVYGELPVTTLEHTQHINEVLDETSTTEITDEY